MDCLSSFVGSIYQSLCDKEFTCAAFVVVEEAYDSVHIPVLIN